MEGSIVTQKKQKEVINGAQPSLAFWEFIVLK